MNGIINSDLKVSDLLDAYDNREVHHKVLEALKEPDYLIALLQKSFFDHVGYSFDDPRFDNITPAQFRATMQKALQKLEDGVWEAIRNAEHECECGGFKSHKVGP